MIEQKELPYTYVFIRKDLSYAQQIVQASHATLEAGFKFDQPAEISRIVLFPLNNEKQLFDRARHLRENGIEHVLFYEPDIEQYTAISTAPIFVLHCIRKCKVMSEFHRPMPMWNLNGVWEKNQHCSITVLIG